MAGRSIKFITDTVRCISTKPSTNGEILPRIYNRNPRNLEKLRLQRKPLGYGLEETNVEFWHKLEILPHSKHLVAQVVHNSRKVVIHASTNEWAIRKQLFSTTDMQAYIVLANVFAERCLESGIISFYINKREYIQQPKVQEFLKVIETEGLMLEEPSCYAIHDVVRKDREKLPWTVLED